MGRERGFFLPTVAQLRSPIPRRIILFKRLTLNFSIVLSIFGTVVVPSSTIEQCCPRHISAAIRSRFEHGGTRSNQRLVPTSITIPALDKNIERDPQLQALAKPIGSLDISPAKKHVVATEQLDQASKDSLLQLRQFLSSSTRPSSPPQFETTSRPIYASGETRC
ncbi:hypothetical protein BT69DRAFT_829367 [Atractiella rhizophila]|nr:hypothetical protein BT69DRAFT_829367 [Atractiella rhizophila]